MVSDFGNTTDFVPLDITSDPLLGAIDANTSTTAGDNLSNSSILSGIGDTFGTIGDLITAAEKLVPTLVSLIQDVANSHPVDIITQLQKYASSGVKALDISSWFGTGTQGLLGSDATRGIYTQSASAIWSWMVNTAEGAWMTGLLTEGLGLDISQFDEEGQRGIQTSDAMIGFAIMLQFGILFVEHAGSGLFGNRWPKVLSETLSKIPEEMGLSWAMGLTIDKAFDAAVGESIGNNIRRQKMPNKPEWPVARTMLRQHVITDSDLDDILSDAGYSPHWKDAIKALETAPIPVGDIQALYQTGALHDNVSLAGSGGSGNTVSSASDLPPDSLDYWLIKLGFSNEALKYVKQVYITKAETSTGAEIRSVWRTLFRNSLVTEKEYRDKLASVNFPQMLIDNDVQAVLDEKQYGWKVQQISVIKSDYLHHPGTQDTAIQKLQIVGYSKADATEMVNAWTAPPTPKHRGLTAAQVLKFYAAGITLNPSAYDQLIALGYDSSTATFMLAHPLGTTGAHVARLTPGLVIQAFLDGAILQSDLRTQLDKAGAKNEVQDYYYNTALYRYARHHVAGSGQQPLSEGDIKEAFKHGIMDYPTAQTALEGLGYSASNATIILEIVNKGPIVPPPQPAFGSVQQAISFLQFLGITVEPPIDSTYESAISMVESAGYSVQYPPNFVIPRTGQTSNVGV